MFGKVLHRVRTIAAICKKFYPGYCYSWHDYKVWGINMAGGKAMTNTKKKQIRSARVNSLGDREGRQPLSSRGLE